MANVITDPDELGKSNLNQPGQNNGTNQAGQAPAQNSSQAPTITSNQTSNPNQQKGSGYTNIQKVIQANQGNQLGSAVGNNIQQVGSSAQNNLKNAQNQFNQQSAQNQFATDDNSNLVKNVLQDPTKYITNDQNNPNSAQGNQFKTLISGQYQGPQGLAGADQLQSQAQNVAQQGQALGSAGGRLGLLQQQFGNSGYTAGQQNLDNLLLGQSNSPALQAAKRQALMLQGKTNSAIAGAGAQGQQYSDAAKQFGQGVQDQFGNAITAKDQALQDAATKAQTDRDANYSQTLQDLQTGNVTEDEAKLLGLSQGQNTFGLLQDPNKFLTQNALKASAQNVATADDYARLNALKSLGGGFGPQAATDVFQKYQDPTQAGQFNAAPAITGDASGFGTAVQGTQQDFLNHLKAITPEGFDAIGNMSGISGVGQNIAAQGAAGGAAGGSLGSLGGAAGTAAGTAYGALAGAIGGAFSDPSNDASQARETAKQQASMQLSDYYNKLKTLAGQNGMNLGARQNMTPDQVNAWLDPQNVGANYGNIIKELQGDLTSNNKINIRPNGSAYPSIAGIGRQQPSSQNPDDLENMPQVKG